jgi:hypothetical protein
LVLGLASILALKLFLLFLPWLLPNCWEGYFALHIGTAVAPSSYVEIFFFVGLNFKHAMEVR